MSSTILVTGATGNVGRHVTSQLAEAGLEVRALVRDPERARLPERVEVVRGDLTAPETLEPALKDVESVFLLWPAFTADGAAEVVAAVARHARRVVYLSANAADEPETHYHEVEQLIRNSGLGWTFLRPGGFAANTLMWAGQIRDGVVRWPYGRAARSLIHEKDIAAVAVHVLTSAGHKGATYVLSGPELLTQEEQVRVIGEAVGREVRWEELPVEVAREELLAAWGDAAFVDSALSGWARFVTAPEEVTGTVERLLGRPALTLGQWARDHASDFG
ncbi:NAD(P)H-binding protein [Nonomuraea phyllanthi]|uniref:NAD(P)H-binding protein n=1 Tax=Nonomuraea phyllanthi TaxID=2219224 RepID=A0A5C4VW25_9ACTN|nr:NAD(P)H-binding protein [Nonomuraea phyllanthi]KAB8190379.1 NAD(P)H-binding protein [Nonomuraea phyllanthi]